MNRVDPRLARRATALLVGIAAGDKSLVLQYYALLFDFLARIALRRGSYLAADAAQGLGAGTPTLSAFDQETVAYDAAKLALWRAVAAAERFDPSRGDGASWALGNLGMAYRDAAIAETGARRTFEAVATDVATLEEAAPWVRDPELQVEARAGLRWALSTLSSEERTVIVARLHYGMSYTEIAAEVLGDVEATKRVDRILQTARTKLADAHRAWLKE